MGSDVLAAIMALQYGFSCNLTFHADPSHGACRDMERALKMAGLSSYMFLMLVVENIPHGPWADDQRWQQMCEAEEEIFKTFDPDEMPLYAEWGHKMMLELGFTPGVDTMEQVFDHCRELGLMKRKGYKLNTNRFMGPVRALGDMVGTVWCRCFLYNYISLEMGFRTKAGAGKLDVPAEGTLEAQTVETTGTTTTSVASLDHKVLRKSAQNAMHVGATVLENPSYKKVACVVAFATKPVESWHGAQNQRLRSVEECRQWQIDQSTGGWYDHVNEIVKRFSSTTALLECGFDFVEARRPTPLQQMMRAGEDDLAQILLDVSLQLMAARYRRGIYLTSGWPGAFPRFLAESAPIRARALRDFHEDWQAYKWLRDLEVKNSEVKKLLKRSCFVLKATLQIVRGCEAEYVFS